MMATDAGDAQTKSAVDITQSYCWEASRGRV